MCHYYSRQRRCECGFVTHSWNHRKICLRMRAKALLRQSPEEDLFGMCGTVHYKLAKASISVCGPCALRDTQQQLLGSSRTRD